MNKTIEKYAREQIKSGLNQLEEECQMLFKRMYSHNDLKKSIEKVVDDMPTDKLNWALSQIENTLAKKVFSNDK